MAQKTLILRTFAEQLLEIVNDVDASDQDKNAAEEILDRSKNHPIYTMERSEGIKIENEYKKYNELKIKAAKSAFEEAVKNNPLADTLATSAENLIKLYPDTAEKSAIVSIYFNGLKDVIENTNMSVQDRKIALQTLTRHNKNQSGALGAHLPIATLSSWDIDIKRYAAEQTKWKEPETKTQTSKEALNRFIGTLVTQLE